MDTSRYFRDLSVVDIAISTEACRVSIVSIAYSSEMPEVTEDDNGSGRCKRHRRPHRLRLHGVNDPIRARLSEGT